MATIVIFWCALLATLFWLLTLFFKGIMSLISGLVKTLAISFLTCFFGGIGILGLYLMYAIAQSVREGNVGELIGMIFFFILEIVIIIIIIGFFGGGILAIIAGLVTAIVDFLIKLLSVLEEWMEKAYYFFLNKVKVKIENS